MYLVTKQIGSNTPHEWELVHDRECAVSKAMELSLLRCPTDLSDDEWERRQGNQYTPTRWHFWYNADDSGDPIHIYIRKFNTGEVS